MVRTLLFWDGPMCSGVDRTKYSEQKQCLYFQDMGIPMAPQVLKLLEPQDEGTVFLQNGRICQPHYTTSYPRGPQTLGNFLFTLPKFLTVFIDTIPLC